MGYSQNNEEQIVLEYFGQTKGIVLDIGANDGKTLSNSLALIEQGWCAVLVEPSQIAFDKMCDLHAGNEKVFCFQLAISNISAKVDFYSSGQHLNVGDTDLVSTLSYSDKTKWESTTTYQTTKVMSHTFNQLLSVSPLNKFDFITIDAEGYDWIILSQIDLNEVGCSCLCIEHNGDAEMLDKTIRHVSTFGLKEIHRNLENIIFAK